MSDRIAVFHAAPSSRSAAPQELYERPANAFVAHSSARTTGSRRSC